LVSIKTFADLLPVKYDEADFREMFSGVVSHEITRLNDLVGELLNFVKEPALLIEKFLLSDLISEVLTLLSPQLESQGIKVIEKYHDEKVTIAADRALIKQALLNICVNAIHAMPDGGVIIVGTLDNDSEAVIYVEDSGIGVSEAIIDKIFDPFITNKANGLGIGLSISHKLVTAHGGRILFKSSKGLGSKFEILLPLR